MIVKIKPLLMIAATLLLVVGFVLSAVGESRRSPKLIRACGLGITGIALGSLVAIAMAA